MSQVIVMIGKAPTSGPNGTANTLEAGTIRAEEITSSATSQATTITAKRGDAATIVNNGNDAVWCEFGSAPTASVANRLFIEPNGRADVAGLAAGWKVAVINDS